MIDLPEHKTYTKYKRDLDIGDAVSTVQYQSNGVQYKREFFVSHYSDVLVGHLSADKPKSYSGHIGLDDSHKAHPVIVNNTITITSALNNGLKYEWQV